MVVEFLRQRREFIVVYNHCKALGTVLTDKGLDNRESLTRTRSANHPSTAEGIHDIHPALAELTLIVVAHRDIDAILVLHLVRHLLKTLVLEVEAVFQETVFQVLGDIVKSHMAKNRADDRHHEIQPCAAV